MIEVNLHPEGGRARRRRRRGGLPSFSGLLQRLGGAARGDRDPWQIAAIAIPAVVVLAVGWLWLSTRSEARGLETRIEEAVEDSARLADLRALSDSLIERSRSIRERVELVRALDEGRFVWPHVLDEVARALPEFTWLTLIRRASPAPDLRVEVQGLAANPLAITEFVRRLQTSPFVEEVQILGSQQQEVEQVTAQRFRLVIAYAQPPDSLIRRVPIGAVDPVQAAEGL